MISFKLTYPPTANGLFANDSRTGGRIKTKEYRKWCNDAGWEIVEQGRTKIAGPVVVALECRAPDNRARDIDNLLKPVLDLLVRMQVIEDDKSSIVRTVIGYWNKGDPGVTVTVWKTN